MQLEAEHGQPLLFGKDREKGLRMNRHTLELEVVTLGDDGVREEDIIVHDETNRTIGGALARLKPPDFPVAIGVLYCSPAEQSYERAVRSQNRAIAEKAPTGGDMNALLHRGATWDVAA